jgi:hypothetical protein
MKMRKALTLLFGMAIALIAVPGALAAPSAPDQAWSVQALAAPTNFTPGDSSGLATYEAFIANSGAATTDHSQITITDTLPEGLTVKSIDLQPPRGERGGGTTGVAPGACETKVAGAQSTVICKVTDALLPEKEPAKLLPDDELRLAIHVIVPPSASGTLTNRVQVSGGGALQEAFAESHNLASTDPVQAGFQSFESELTTADGETASEAASHPYEFTSTFAVNTELAPPGSNFPLQPAKGNLKQIEVPLPPGFLANPTASERCSAQDFNAIHSAFVEGSRTIFPNACPAASAVGVLSIRQLEGAGSFSKAPIFNLVPPKGMPAQFGFQVFGLPVYIDAKVRTGSDYGATGLLHNLPETKRITAGRTTFWGVPADPVHDPLRGGCAEGLPGPCGAEVIPKPFLRLPSDCASALPFTMSFLTWAQPPTGASAATGLPAPLDCAAPDFSPTIQALPSTNVADSPSGLHVDLHLPQAENEKDVEGRGEADLRDASVTLPPGLLVNPAAADGLGACSSEQIGLTTALGQLPPHFSEAPANCPDAAKVGSVELDTPLLDHSVKGSVYLAKQGDNPFKSLLAIYISLDDPQSGIVAKLAGEVKPDPKTGQLTTVVAEGPQVPFEDFRFDFFEGARAPLRTPGSCGTHTTATTLVPWSSPERASQSPASSFAISAGPTGPCPNGALAPKLSAGLANPTAGTYSPFSLRLTRADATDEFAGLTALPPLGLTAKLAGIPYCPDAAIAQAASRTAPGQGAQELASPSCPSASKVGSVTAGAGAGPSPYFTGGNLYLTGPYKGAPISFLAVIPAVAGPFDLGVVTTRIASYVDPETAQVKTVADPLPTILAGIPLDVRDIRANLDRAGFTLAPTSCEPKSVSATVLGVSGASATVSDRFQVGGCQNLRFKPGLSLKLNGGTKRGAHPSLKATLTYPKGNYANLARASVGLPHSEFLEQAHIRTICTRVQFAANACPKGSIYGKAWATSPLLDKRLEGPVYLRSSSNPLPDMVVALHGQIDVAAVGRIDSKNGGIRSTFETVPDAPISKFVLEMQGGKKGLFVNSRDICNYTNRATAKFTGQNGKRHDFRPVLRDGCKGKGKKK